MACDRQARNSPQPVALFLLRYSAIDEVMVGPDFICIGMAKAGTGWLYDQTRNHPDFWMPPIKEIAYIQRPLNFVRRARSMLARAAGKREKKEGTRTHQVASDCRSLEFVREAAEMVRRPIDFSAYGALFRYKGELLSGDVTPAYSGLPEDRIAALALHFPHTRILLLVRDPVERLWSHISMAVRGGKIGVASLSQRSSFEELLRSHPIAGFGSFPTRIVSRWRTTAPQLAFKSVLLDDLASRPEQTRSEILRYLGAEPDKPSGELPAGHNRKSGASKMEMPDHVVSVLRDRYAEEISACADLFGGAARQWPIRYGL